MDLEGDFWVLFGLLSQNLSSLAEFGLSGCCGKSRRNEVVGNQTDNHLVANTFLSHSVADRYHHPQGHCPTQLEDKLALTKRSNDTVLTRVKGVRGLKG